MKNIKYVGKIDDLPLIDCCDFILGADAYELGNYSRKE